MTQVNWKSSSQSIQNNTLWLFGLVVFLSVILLLWYFSVDRYDSYIKEITKLTKISAQLVADEISEKINKSEDDILEFSMLNNKLLSDVYIKNNITSDENRLLNYKISTVFPDTYFYAIANQDGKNIFNTHGKDIGITCKEDLIEYADNNYKNQRLKIHSHGDGYHYDVMVPFINDAKEINVLFMAFIADDLVNLLRKNSSDEYQLFITNNIDPGLVEITPLGVRNNSIEKVYLREDQMERVLNKVPISGTLWQLDVLAYQDLFKDLKINIIRDSGIIFLMFLLITFPLFYLLNRQFIGRREVLEKLKESESMFFDLYEQAPDMYITVNNEGKIQSANRCAREYFGRTTEELVDEGLMNVIRPEDIEGVANHFRCIFENKIAESEYECNTKDRYGNSKVMHARFSLNQKNEQDDSPNVRIVCRDITEQRKLESERIDRLRSQRDTLVKEVHHRIKNNLQSVAALLKTYSRNNPELKDIIRDASSKINSIAQVYGLQSLAQKQDVYLSDLLNSIVENESKLFLTKIKLEIPDDIVKKGKILETEVIPVAVIISELLTNAIKYTEEIGIERSKVIRVNLTILDDKYEIKIINEIKNDLHKIDVHEDIGLGQGLNLVKALIPAKGIRITHSAVHNKMNVTLLLEYPVVY